MRRVVVRSCVRRCDQEPPIIVVQSVKETDPAKPCKAIFLRCRRLILTHMSHDMLSHLDEVEFECAEDGKLVIL